MNIHKYMYIPNMFYLINYLKASFMFGFYEMHTFSYLNILLKTLNYA